MNVGSTIGKTPDVRMFSPSNQLVLPNCYIGVEAELERVGNVSLDGLWHTKSDGSLHDNGLEYVFSQPLFGNDIINALDQLESAFTSSPPSISNDTSLHIHVDIRDLSWEQLWKFIMLYIIYEQVLFNYCSPDRENNIFCLSTKRAKRIITTYSRLLDIIKNEAYSDSMYLLNEVGRYGGINIAAITHFGSLEFRGHKGEWQKEPILRWINILMCLKKAAMDDTIPWERPYVMIKNEGAFTFTTYVFGEYADYLNFPDFHLALHEGMQLARSAVNLYSHNTKAALKGSVSNPKKSILNRYKNKHAPNKKGTDYDLGTVELTSGRESYFNTIMEHLGDLPEEYINLLEQLSVADNIGYIERCYTLLLRYNRTSATRYLQEFIVNGSTAAINYYNTTLSSVPSRADTFRVFTTDNVRRSSFDNWEFVTTTTGED